ncbi:MAG: hypothetical protein NVSMB14_01370 [Isosphaeraceae bacterium]
MPSLEFTNAPFLQRHKLVGRSGEVTVFGVFRGGAFHQPMHPDGRSGLIGTVFYVARPGRFVRARIEIENLAFHGKDK